MSRPPHPKVYDATRRVLAELIELHRIWPDAELWGLVVKMAEIGLRVQRAERAAMEAARKPAKKRLRLPVRGGKPRGRRKR